jgi:hypothetical protein
MCTGRTIRMTVAAVLLLTGGATVSLGEKLQQPLPEDRLGRILNDWERRSSTRTNLDIRFKGIERDKAWGEEFILVGRVVLLPKGRGLVEVVKYDKDRKVGESDRCVWTNDAMHQIRPERKSHIIWPIAPDNRGRLPAVLALPFLWHVSVEGLNSRYRVELANEDARNWVLRITPRSAAGVQSFSQAFLWLDRATYLPRRYYLLTDDGKYSTDYCVTETQCDLQVPDEDLQIPSDNGWHVTLMGDATTPALYQLVKPDLLP